MDEDQTRKENITFSQRHHTNDEVHHLTDKKTIEEDSKVHKLNEKRNRGLFATYGNNSESATDDIGSGMVTVGANKQNKLNDDRPGTSGLKTIIKSTTKPTADAASSSKDFDDSTDETLSDPESDSNSDHLEMSRPVMNTHRKYSDSFVKDPSSSNDRKSSRSNVVKIKSSPAHDQNRRFSVANISYSKDSGVTIKPESSRVTSRETSPNKRTKGDDTSGRVNKESRSLSATGPAIDKVTPLKKRSMDISLTTESGTSEADEGDKQGNKPLPSRIALDKPLPLPRSALRHDTVLKPIRGRDPLPSIRK